MQCQWCTSGFQEVQPKDDAGRKLIHHDDRHLEPLHPKEHISRHLASNYKGCDRVLWRSRTSVAKHGHATVTGAGHKLLNREQLHNRAWCLNSKIHVHETKGIQWYVGACAMVNTVRE